MSREKNRVITIGGTGLVGSVLIPYLRQYYEVEDHSIDSPDPKNRLDLVDTDSFEAVIANNHRDILAVINLAAATDTNRAFSDSEYQQLCHRINHFAPRDASRLCQTINIPFLHVSTDFVYDGKKTPPDTYLETDIPLPIEFYGAMKTNGEVAVLRHGGTVLTLAFPFTPNPIRSDLVSKFTSKLSRGNL